MGEQLLDPAGRRRGRAAHAQARVDRPDGGGGHVVELQVLLGRAGPEHLEVGLVPHLERPVLDQVLEAVAVGQVRDQVADQVVPAVPVLAAATRSRRTRTRSCRVGREVVRHERQLHDRVQPDRAQVVVDPVDAGEVVHRLAVDLAVDAEVVAEDRVGPHVGDAELVVRGLQRRGQLLADHPAAGGVGREHVGEVLAADHRPPRPRQRRPARRAASTSTVTTSAGRRAAWPPRRPRSGRPRRARRRARSRRTTATPPACRSCRRTADGAPRARRDRRGRAAPTGRRPPGRRTPGSRWLPPPAPR